VAEFNPAEFCSKIDEVIGQSDDIAFAILVMYQEPRNVLFSVIGIVLLTLLILFTSMLIIKMFMENFDRQICVEE
jgi:hypothetical protein